MSDQTSFPIQLQALPDGGAELHLVVRLRWEDIAALGREAGRLAVRLQRPVSLDEAAADKLSGRPAASARDLPEAPAAPVPRALPVGPRADQPAPQANGTGGTSGPAASAAPPQSSPLHAAPPGAPSPASSARTTAAPPHAAPASARSAASAVPAAAPPAHAAPSPLHAAPADDPMGGGVFDRGAAVPSLSGRPADSPRTAG